MRLPGLAALLVAACASYEPVPIPPGLLELEGAVEDTPALQGYLGLDVTPNESDSIEELDVRPGLRVSKVAAGSPGERAGIKPSDVLLQFDGVPINDRERLDSLLLAVAEPKTVVLQLQRGTRVYEVQAELEVREGKNPGRTLYHVDRVRLRAAFRDGRGDGAYPEVAYLAEDSPLRAAGVTLGDRVLAFQGRDPGSASALVRAAALELEPGERGTLRLRRADGREAEVEFEAWSPGRRLIGFEIWPLYDWEAQPAEDRSTLVVGDFFLFSLFKRKSVGDQRYYSILSLIQWETGEATLQETGVIPAGEPGP